MFASGDRIDLRIADEPMEKPLCPHRGVGMLVHEGDVDVEGRFVATMTSLGRYFIDGTGLFPRCRG
jgi:hypothetical protein